MLRLLPLLAAAVLPAPAAASGAELDLVPLGRTPALGEAAAEIAAHDSRTQRAFVTNAADNALDVYDVRDPADPLLVRRIDLAPFGGGPNSVDVAGSRRPLVAVAVEADEKTDPGSVVFFDPHGRYQGRATVGALPDMLTFTRDARTVLVANEGEPSDDYGIDPEGSVSLVDVRRGPARASVRTAGFAGVPLQGPVRVFGPGASVAQDLEPEYVAPSPDGRVAYVSLQEANAVGILDLRRRSFRVVRSLGFKDHGLAGHGLDASDRDGGPNVRPWANVRGMYQPDALAAYATGRRTYVVTANEGDARDYDTFAEEERAGDLPLDPAAFPAGSGEDAALGRLTVTTTLGDADGNGLYEALYAFGGRSMSVLDAEGRVTYDTGDELERRTLALDPATFNTDNEADSSVDNRSDNKGPEPEGLAVGEVARRPYAFVAAERSGGLFAYDLAARPGEAAFAGYLSTRPDDLGPEGVRFVAARESPTRRPLLLVTNEISGTLTLVEVR